MRGSLFSLSPSAPALRPARSPLNDMRKICRGVIYPARCTPCGQRSSHVGKMNPPAVLAGFGEAENSGRTPSTSLFFLVAWPWDGPQGDAYRQEGVTSQKSSSNTPSFCSERCWYGHEDGASAPRLEAARWRPLGRSVMRHRNSSLMLSAVK